MNWYKKCLLLIGVIFTVILQVVCSKFMQLEKSLWILTSLFYFVLIISILESICGLYKKVEFWKKFFKLIVSISGLTMLVTMLLELYGSINNANTIYNIFVISFFTYLICWCILICIEKSER